MELKFEVLKVQHLQAIQCVFKTLVFIYKISLKKGTQEMRRCKNRM